MWWVSTTWLLQSHPLVYIHSFIRLLISLIVTGFEKIWCRRIMYPQEYVSRVHILEYSVLADKFI